MRGRPPCATCGNTIDGPGMADTDHNFHHIQCLLGDRPASPPPITNNDIDCWRNTAGGWVLSAIIDNHLVTRQYYGYRKHEAYAQFKQEFSRGS